MWYLLLLPGRIEDTHVNLAVSSSNYTAWNDRMNEMEGGDCDLICESILAQASTAKHFIEDRQFLNLNQRTSE